MLHVVCCHFNPAGYQRPRDNLRRFRDSLDHPITMVEACFDGRFESDSDIAIKADPTTQTLWQKEQLLNLGFASLPATATKIAWIDADVLFDRSDWAAATEQLLDDYPIIQMFERAAMLDVHGAIQREHFSKAAVLTNSSNGRTLRPQGLKTGFAWAARREAIGLDQLGNAQVDPFRRRGGLFDLDVVGGGDSSMVSAWTGRTRDWLVRHMNREFRTAFQPWAVDAWHRVRGRVGCLSGRIRHLYHGSHRNRQYGSRIAPLRAARYTPQEDIRLAANGLWEWSSDKPAMHEAVRRYFISRDEDG